MISIYNKNELNKNAGFNNDVNGNDIGIGRFIKDLRLKGSGSRMDSPEVVRTVYEIISAVRSEGDAALVRYTERFDGVGIPMEGFEIAPEDMEAAYRIVPKELVAIIRRARQNIYDFHSRQLERSWFDAEKNGILLGQLYRPLDIAGVYVPGGTAPLPSSVLMNVVPAKVAKVKTVVMCTPPVKNPDIKCPVDPVILVAASEAGVDRIFRVGGAQAIAAMAYGTRTIPRVDKITGPGNIYVNAAKKMVFGQCDIDIIAGPSEILIIADNTANPSFVAADMLSQAEHDVLASSILITVSQRLAEAVRSELDKQVALLERADIARKSIDDFGAVIVVDSLAEAFEAANEIAPEHLELCIAEPMDHLSEVRHAGAVFLGNYSPEPVGDYYAGPNHVLPTGGTARFFSALGTDAFIKKISVVSYSEEALNTAADDIIKFAEAEGLTAHANAVRKRESGRISQ